MGSGGWRRFTHWHDRLIGGFRMIRARGRRPNLGRSSRRTRNAAALVAFPLLGAVVAASGVLGNEVGPAGTGAASTLRASGSLSPDILARQVPGGGAPDGSIYAGATDRAGGGSHSSVRHPGGVVATSDSVASHGSSPAAPGGRSHDGLPANVPIPVWAVHHSGIRFLPEPAAARAASAARQRSSGAQASAASTPPPATPAGAGASSGQRGGAGNTVTGGETSSGPAAHAATGLGRRCEGGYCPGIPLLYKGGTVQHNPVVHTIFWGSNWTETTAGQELQTQMTKLYQGLSGSAWQGVLTQYFDVSENKLSYISPTVTANTFTDTRVKAPSELTDKMLQEEVAYAVSSESHTGWTREPSAQFAIILAPGTTFKGGYTGVCAYHSETEDGFHSSYTFVPDINEEPFRAHCIGYDPERNGNNVTSMVASHEYAEAATDPEPGSRPGWQDAEGNENGDICVSGDDQIKSGPMSGNWVQGTWDDFQGACSLGDENPPHILGLTEAASKLSRHEATLNGEIYPEGQKTEYYFQWGPTTAYGETSSRGSVEGLSGQSVSQAISGLKLETTYHYRVVATSAAGTDYGEDQTVKPAQWTVGELQALPNSQGNSNLTGISCRSPEWCMGAGWQQLGGGEQVPYAQLWNGSKWSLQTASRPGEASGALSGGVAVDSSGNVWVSDKGGNRVVEFSSSGEFKLTFGWGVNDGRAEAETCTSTEGCRAGIAGSGAGQLSEPAGIAIAGSQVWVVDHGNSRVEEFSTAGAYLNKQIEVGSVQFPEAPNGVALDGHGDMFVASSGYGAIQKYSIETGEQLAQVLTWVNGYVAQRDVVVDQQGNVWVADGNRVREFSNNLEFKIAYGWGVNDGEAKFETCTSSECQVGVAGSGEGQFNNSGYLAFDANGNLWVSDQGNNRVQELSSTGSYVTQFGAGKLHAPGGIAITSAALYVGNQTFGGVEKWTRAGEGVPPTYSSTFGTVGTNNYFAGDSCTATTACTAVGAYEEVEEKFVPLAERWNGATWSVQPISAPSGAKETRLTGVSCFSTTECMAAGFMKNSSGTIVPYAALWRGGTWTSQSLPPVSEGGAITELTSISCSSATFCMAVGRTKGEGTTGMPFAETWTGSEWKIVSPATPEGWQSGIASAVSCSAPNACMLVGQYRGPHLGFNANYWGSWVERWNGSGWSEQAYEKPGGFIDGNFYVQDGFGGVSCWAPESCVLTGNYEITVGHWVTNIEQWNGQTFHIQRNPAEQIAENSGLGAVSCVREAACAATGVTAAFYEVQMAEIRPETTMGIQSTPTPAGATHVLLSGSSCAASTACIDVGSYHNSSGTIVSLADSWNGFEWKTQTTPNPSGARETELHRVSCTGTSLSACTAVGFYKNSSGTIVTLAERWNGSEWKVQATPNPNGARESKLTGVSCTSATSCSAVGFYKNNSNVIVSLAESWNGSEWKVQATPNPSGATKTQLLGVSCSASTACTAVGTYANGSAETLSLAESWNGTEWKVQTTPNPAGGKAVELSAVSCPAAGSCTAVGSYTNSSSNPTSLAEAWNGSTWQIQAVEAPAGAAQSRLLGVSCTVLGGCTAVGWSKASSGNATPLAELWNSREWNSWSVPSPSSQGGELQDISCLSKYACESAGTYTNSSSAQVSLAEGLGAAGASTGAAKAVGDHNATLTGSVQPNVLLATYRFEYGETTAYGNSVPVPSAPLPSETGASEVQQGIGNLKTNTTYHFRLVTSSEGGTTYGPDRTLTTVSSPTFTTAFGSLGSANGQLNGPQGDAVDSAGNVWVSDTANNRVDEFSSSGEFKLTFGWGVKDGNAAAEVCSSTESCRAGIAGSGAGQLNEPAGIAVAGSQVWVVDRRNNRVEEFSTAGAYLNKQIATGSAEFPISPNGVALDGHGDLYVTGSSFGSVQKYSIETGAVLAQYLTYVNGYIAQYGVAVDPQGNVWVADANRVREFSSSLELKLGYGWGVSDGEARFETCGSECKLGVAGSGEGQFNNPGYLTIDAAGNLWVADQGNGRIEELSLGGQYITQFGSAGSGSGQFASPQGIAVSGGAAYVVDSGNNRVEKWSVVE
jgi:sugar lactone lactonase YvrE